MADRDLVVLRDGRALLGDIVEEVFSLRDEVLGQVDHAQGDIAWIILSVYGRDKQDQMMLHDQTRYLGELLNKAITMAISGTPARRITTDHIRVIKFDFMP